MELTMDPFLDFEQLEKITNELQREAPHLVRTGEIGFSREGRRLLLLTITDFATGEPETKPGFVITANIHCHELAGPLAALYTANELVKNHKAGGILSHTVFYIFPRVNPDNTEQVIKHSGYIRSRCDYSDRPNTFLEQDIDGNNRILQMRIPTSDGNMCCDPDNPNCMIPRTANSTGPFYRVCNEGLIHNYDGNATNFIYGGIMRDYNRNWPYRWSPEKGNAGDFPLCELETWHLAQFLAMHKNLFMILDYHNGWGSIYRPREQEVEESDWKTYNVLARAGEQYTGYPACPSRFVKDTGFTTDNGGMLVEHSYFNMGLFAWTVELGTFEHSAGITTEDILKHDYESDYHPHPKLFEYQKKHPELRPALYPWKKFMHPQLGAVEIGGMDIPVFAVLSREDNLKLCRNTHLFTMFLAEKQPKLQCLEKEVRKLAEGVFRLRIKLLNAGELPTNVTGRALKLPRCRKPFVELDVAKGMECISFNHHFELEHFAPWESKTIEWFFQGSPLTEKIASVHVSGGPAGSFIIDVTQDEIC